MCSAFNPSKWSSGQPTLRRWGAVGGSVLAKGLTSVVDTSARAGIRTHNLGLPQVSSPTLYPLGHELPHINLKNVIITFFFVFCVSLIFVFHYCFTDSI